MFCDITYIWFKIYLFLIFFIDLKKYLKLCKNKKKLLDINNTTLVFTYTTRFEIWYPDYFLRI